MHKTLIINAFEKVKVERKKQGEKSPSLTNIAEDLASFVKESEGLSLDEKSYRNYFNDARKCINTAEDISIKQLKVVNGLCEFLGFENYEDFTNSIGDKSLSKSLVLFCRKNTVILITLVILVVGSLVYYSVNKQRWMVWDGNSYNEAKFDAEELSNGILKLHNENRIEYFKKIVPDCNTIFFKEDGTENLWYGKNSNGELEYFTALGLHPETKKTLKKITKHMIKKYICEEF